MNKKQVMLAVLMVCAAITLTQAQLFYPVLKNISTDEKERLEKSYATSLSFSNAGTVESALAIVTMIKLDLPVEEFSIMRDEVRRLAVNGATPVIRYKAYLAEAVFANPAMFKEEAARRYSEPDELFSALAQRITKTLLSNR
jgi:hypothetical protein